MHEDRSPDRRAGMTGPGGRFLFVLSLWMSLATAIVCALAPAGLPLTRSTGSAFDPSTTIVALRSRPPAQIRATLLRTGEGDGAGMGDGPAALMMAAPAIILGAAILIPASGFRPSAFLLLPRAIPVALYARPPPAA